MHKRLQVSYQADVRIVQCIGIGWCLTIECDAHEMGFVVGIGVVMTRTPRRVVVVVIVGNTERQEGWGERVTGRRDREVGGEREAGKSSFVGYRTK